ncbi:hypothetical protein [Telluribacter sp. SYSU D00476]|uniref:hypothetical protein n=1 Tax=Telluribacter sp. SYSU D00476 TaxID=2811430 RepID=UPI001FF680C2|nr:hypothetical protein [Telluribacter sp. SYSU D00476]
MKFVSLTGTVFEGHTSEEVLMQIRNDFCSGADMEVFLDQFASYLHTHYCISISSQDPNEILEQLLDQAYLLKIN